MSAQKSGSRRSSSEAFRTDAPMASLHFSAAPSRPTSPEKFSVPHVCARFGPGGQLIKVLPNLPSDGQPALVEVHSMEVIRGPRSLSSPTHAQKTRLRSAAPCGCFCPVGPSRAYPPRCQHLSPGSGCQTWFCRLFSTFLCICISEIREGTTFTFILLEIFDNGWRCFLSVWLVGVGCPVSQSLCHVLGPCLRVWGEMGLTTQERA